MVPSRAFESRFSTVRSRVCPIREGALKTSIPRLVERGEFGLASGQKADGTYERLWINELVPSEEVTFDSGTFLLQKSRALSLRAPVGQIAPAGLGP